MRTKRTDGSTTYTYTYDGSTLFKMTADTNTLIFAYGANGHPMAVEYNGTSYYYVTNALGDVVAIVNASGVEVVTYVYDAWGNILSTGGTMASTLGKYNPFRYRSYVYDQETGLYYLQSRYYNPTICRFISADAYVSTGQGILGYNMFTYCGNNPVTRIDSDGHAFETIFDIITLFLSVTEVASNPIDGWAWLGLVADFIDLFPFLTGVGESVKAYHLATKVVDGFGDLSQGSKYGIKAYNTLRDLLKGTGLHAHHIIEKRLVKHLGINADQMLSVAVTAAEHQNFTNAWRAYFKYGMDYSDLTRADIWDVAQTIYKDYPDLLDAAYKTLFG